jgi:Reverse transcriptase (RNA-dependent DNA polymerase)
MDIVDDYTSFPWSIPLKHKDNAFPELKAWELACEDKTGLKVGTYITDNGELKSNQIEAWLKSHGTEQRFTAPHTSAHIGRIERMHRTLMVKVCTMRIYAHLPTYLWDEFYLTTVHLHAKTTTHSLKGVTPWELWHEREPDYSYMWEIGSRAFVLIPKKDNPKIFERSIECVLIGYEHKSKAYRCYNRTTHQVHSSYHVCFIESHEGHNPLGPDVSQDTAEPKVEDPTILILVPLPDDDDDGDDGPIPPAHLDTQPPQPPRHSSHIPIPTERNPNGIPTITHTEAAVQASRESAARIREHRREHGTATQAMEQNTADHPDVPAASNDVANSLHQALENLDLGDQAHELLSLISEMTDIDPESLQFEDQPKTWDEAKNSADATKWEAGYRDELKLLKDMGVYKLIPRSEVPLGKCVLKGKRVFHIKHDEEGTAVQWKVRLVFKGFEQIYGKDYTKTTSPTACMESWRILLHLTASLGWDAQ